MGSAGPVCNCTATSMRGPRCDQPRASPSPSPRPSPSPTLTTPASPMSPSTAPTSSGVRVAGASESPSPTPSPSLSPSRPPELLPCPGAPTPCSGHGECVRSKDNCLLGDVDCVAACRCVVVCVWEGVWPTVNFWHAHRHPGALRHACVLGGAYDSSANRGTSPLVRVGAVNDWRLDWPRAWSRPPPLSPSPSPSLSPFW